METFEVSYREIVSGEKIVIGGLAWKDVLELYDITMIEDIFVKQEVENAEPVEPENRSAADEIHDKLQGLPDDNSGRSGKGTKDSGNTGGEGG